MAWRDPGAPWSTRGCSTPDSLDTLGLDEATQRAFLHDNAAHVFGLAD